MNYIHLCIAAVILLLLWFFNRHNRKKRVYVYYTVECAVPKYRSGLTACLCKSFRENGTDVLMEERLFERWGSTQDTRLIIRGALTLYPTPERENVRLNLILEIRSLGRNSEPEQAIFDWKCNQAAIENGIRYLAAQVALFVRDLPSTSPNLRAGAYVTKEVN